VPGSGAERARRDTAAAAARPVYAFSAGFFRRPWLRRLLAVAGYELRFGLPGGGDLVAVWGRGPTAWRGEAVARRRGAQLLRIEDAFLRSLHPGRSGGPPLGLLIDGEGVHFDAGRPSALERLLAGARLDDAALIARAEAGMARMRAAHLGKYAACDPAEDPPPPGYVLVADQVRGDAAIRHGGASAQTFAAMLAAARAAHPRARIVIKTHPETAAGHRAGHFTPRDRDGRTDLLTAPVSPWRLLDGAAAVYTVSSQLGFEAILAGHRPVVFGQPFYAGWGLSEDRSPPPRRGRSLTAAQLFAAAMLEAPVWYDPFRDRRADFETALEILEAEARAWRADRRGYVALGMRLWKRPQVARVFGTAGRGVRFADGADRALGRAAREGRDLLAWAGTAPDGIRDAARRQGVRCLAVEDGFLRSRGLGAALVPPLSLVADDLGIYYDPGRESRLERLIADSADLPGWARDRARRLRAQLTAAGLTKYNLGGGLPALPRDRPVILVAGQVEDDASVLRGAGAVRGNQALLEAARRAHPDACLVYKPHPDVEAGLRPGVIPAAPLAALADVVAADADPAALFGRVDAVWTLTSLLGFEALLRGVPVTCLGVPFYAGWGLTEDIGPVPARRRARPSLDALVHAALIAYPRYVDPLSGRPCPVEVAVDRLGAGIVPRPGPVNRGLSKLQGVFAGQAWIWRG